MNDCCAGLVLQRRSPGAPDIESLSGYGATVREDGSRASRELSLYQTIGGLRCRKIWMSLGSREDIEGAKIKLRLRKQS
jgi:hypothetical protein